MSDPFDGELITPTEIIAKNAQALSELGTQMAALIDTFATEKLTLSLGIHNVNQADDIQIDPDILADLNEAYPSDPSGARSYIELERSNAVALALQVNDFRILHLVEQHSMAGRPAQAIMAELSELEPIMPSAAIIEHAFLYSDTHGAALDFTRERLMQGDHPYAQRLELIVGDKLVQETTSLVFLGDIPIDATVNLEMRTDPVVEQAVLAFPDTRFYKEVAGINSGSNSLEWVEATIEAIESHYKGTPHEIPVRKALSELRKRHYEIASVNDTPELEVANIMADTMDLDQITKLQHYLEKL